MSHIAVGALVGATCAEEGAIVVPVAVGAIVVPVVVGVAVEVTAGARVGRVVGGTVGLLVRGALLGVLVRTFVGAPVLGGPVQAGTVTLSHAVAQLPSP